ncbi:MAG: hypothetical protein K2H31_10555 [Lachnospiraceae bacterium]|nr:hypothetical protein [Lachnospiraceae bacterium]MDE6748142.1 hypothetical protein [Lachnospiraceae bacterium]
MSFQNPAAILQMMNLWNKFKQNHPKFPKFMTAVYQNGIKEGSIIEINVTTADGQSLNSNLKISADDMELIEQLKKLTMNP